MKGRKAQFEEQMDSAAHEALPELAPKTELEQIRKHFRRLPEPLIEPVQELIKLSTNRMDRLLMGAAAAIYAREALKANSGVALLPVGITPGGVCTPNTVYPLQPFTSGVTSGPYQFVTNQVFFDIMTSRVDAENGWFFASNTVKFSNDPLAGMAYGDTGFVNFEADVVAGREILGEYFHHTVIEQLTFFASAILYNSTPQVMKQGPQLRFWDFRCDGEGVNDRNFRVFTGPSFAEVVRDLVEKANGGVSVGHLLGDPALHERLRSLGGGR